MIVMHSSGSLKHP